MDQPFDLAIEVQLTKKDIFRAVRLNAVRRPMFWIAVIMPGFIIFGALITHPYGWIAGTAISLGLFLLIPYQTAITSAKQVDVLAPITYVFSDYGVTAHFQNAENKTAWSLVKGARETADYFFIEMQRKSFHLVPKRTVRDEQAVSLREKLRAHLSKNVRLAT
jgi:YcxB-like protein